MKFRLILALSIFAIAGCSTAPVPVSPQATLSEGAGLAAASGIEYEVTAEQIPQGFEIISRPVNVLNVSPNGRDLVVNEIKRFFDTKIDVRASSNRSVVVQIRQADTVFKFSSASYIPLVGGLAAAASEHDIISPVEVTVLVLDQSGMVIASDSFNETIESQGAMTASKIDGSLSQHLTTLHQRLNRYFDKRFFDRFLGSES